jgi:hypothetical protein
LFDGLQRELARHFANFDRREVVLALDSHLLQSLQFLKRKRNQMSERK